MGDLNARAFVKVEKIFRRFEVQVDDVLHFRKEIRVSDSQKVLVHIRTKRMRSEIAQDSRMTRRTTEDFAVGIEVFRRPSG